MYGFEMLSRLESVSRITCDYDGVPAVDIDKASFPQTINFMMIPAGSAFRFFPVLSVTKLTQALLLTVLPSVLAFK